VDAVAHFHIHQGHDTYARLAPGMCEGVKDALLPECARAVGGGAMFASEHDPEGSKAICKLLPANQLSDCVRGVDYEVRLIKGGLEDAKHHH